MSVVKSVKKIFGSAHDRQMKALRPDVQKIASFEKALKELSDDQLKNKSVQFKEKLSQGATVDDIMHESFAVCREAAWRVLGMRHYDVQMIGGMTLNSGSIAEMRTGEGKTLVATLPTYLNALTGKGSHLVTVNDYLASRDAEWMGQLYNWLGLSVGTIVHNMSDIDRKKAYASDITYGTNNEFGFDYLRDNMKFDPDMFVQRKLNFAIVDECDSILIDEARTPLIISGPSEDSVEKYYEINKIIPSLTVEKDFTFEEKSKTVSLTEEGNAQVEKLLKVGNVYDIKNIRLVHHVYQALKAHHLFHLDVDYMLKDGEVVIIDEFTGRLMPGRRWSDGLHQAVEAKEGVKVRKENQTLATITFQNFFRMYDKLSGMTGTAETEAVEFKKIYNLDVLVVPTNKPIARKDQNDIIFKSDPAKYAAIARDIKERSKDGQPVLVGTVSIDKSEKLSKALKDLGIKHNVLNAKYHEKEAEIVSQAGSKSAITIATNMAGRGTDIVLGGNAESLARKESGEKEGPAFDASFAKFTASCNENKKQVIAAGGLYVVGTERHEARRVDNQLRGRSGRQGDPGESRFYLSLEDDLMRIFNGERMKRIMDTLNVPEDEPIEAKMVSRAIEGAQKKVEGHNFDIRKHLLDFDDVMNQQREFVYTKRREILTHDPENLERSFLDMLGEVSSDILDNYAPQDLKASEWDLNGFQVAAAQQFGLRVQDSDLKAIDSEKLENLVSKHVKELFANQKTVLGEHFHQLLKVIMLQTIDLQWKDHLLSIDQLKDGINLRAYAQKDPIIEYKKEAFAAFAEMQSQIRSEVVEKILKVRLQMPDHLRDMEDSLEEGSRSGAQEEHQSVSSFDQKNLDQKALDKERQSKMQLSGGGRRPPERQLNRADRRRMKKR